MSSHQQNQKIGFWPLTSLVTGNLVGSGVFLLPTTLAHFGSISLVAWGVTVLGAVMLALIFAELSHKLPQNGGPFAFVAKAFGPQAGFFTAWGYWILSWISNAALVASAAGYFVAMYGHLDKAVILAIEIGILSVITGFNLFGLRTTGRAELIITTTKVIPLILIPLACLYAIDFANFPAYNITEMPNSSALNAAAFITLWGFLGLETATVTGGQVINARKIVPLATITGTIIAATIYILGTVVIFGVLPFDTLMSSKAPYADAAGAVFGGSWAVAISIAAIITCVGSLNGWTIIVGKIAQAAASEGLFPPAFGRTNSQGAPYWAILSSSILTIPFIIMSLEDNLVEQFNLIIDISVTFILFVYLACVLAFFKLVLRDKEHRIYKAVIGFCALMFVVWAFMATKPIMIGYAAGIALLGAPIFFLRNLKR